LLLMVALYSLEQVPGPGSPYGRTKPGRDLLGLRERQWQAHRAADDCYWERYNDVENRAVPAGLRTPRCR